MSQETQILKWTKTPVFSGKNFMSVDEEGNPYLVDASAILNSAYQGKCFTSTDPGTLTIDEKGYWYFCGETGTFTNFDGLTCNKNDQLWWNGSSWDRIETASNTSGSKFEAIATDGQQDFLLGTQLSADDDVKVAGKTLFSTAYSGVGTTTIHFIAPLDEFDEVVIQHN